MTKENNLSSYVLKELQLDLVSGSIEFQEHLVP